MERPILFSGPMVNAILDGRKTMTRRVVKEAPCECGNDWQPEEMPAVNHEGYQTSGHSGRWWCGCCSGDWVSSRYGQTGDRLWVKEALGCFDGEIPDSYEGRYAADGKVAFHGWQWKRNYLPGMFMPRWASRITIEITGIRVERLQEISEENAKAEGVNPTTDISAHEFFSGAITEKTGLHESVVLPHKLGFLRLWDSINGKKHPWESNPWVWVVEFKKSQPVHVNENDKP